MIITINRQMGSGGHSIGKELAKQLGIPFYDKELIEIASKDSGFAKEFFEKSEEKKNTSFLYTIATRASAFSNFMDSSYSGLTLDDQIFIAQSKAIKKIAKEGPCVIIGRCSNYVLRKEDIFSIYLWADIESRIKRAKQQYGYEDEAREKLLKSDKMRKRYYEYHTDENYNDIFNYDLVLRTDRHTILENVEIIKKYVGKK